MCRSETFEITTCILPKKPNFRAVRDLSYSNLARDAAAIAVDHSVAGVKRRCDLERTVRVG